jgi:hypothetical protein
MDVDVHQRGIDVEVHDTDGIAAGFEDASVGLGDDASEDAIAYDATVDENGESRGTRSSAFRWAEIGLDA